MGKRLSRIAIILLFNLAAIPLLVEGLLRLFDPWGALAYFDDLAGIYASFQNDAAREYSFSPGVHYYSRWSATILPGGLRAVPDSGHSSCRVVLLGDSVTFAWGVDDEDTWANLIARDLPGVKMINAGVPGYNLMDVLRTRHVVSGDVYVYLINDNDNGEGLLPWRDYRRLIGSAIAQYVYAYRFWSLNKRVPPVTPIPRFEEVMNDPQIIAVVFDTTDVRLSFEKNGLSEAILRRYRVKVIPPYSTSVSRLDAHPDVNGNREIAATMLPIVQEAVRKYCTAVI